MVVYHDPRDRTFVPVERSRGVAYQGENRWVSEFSGKKIKLMDRSRAVRYADLLSDLYAAGLKSPVLIDMKDAILQQNPDFPFFQYVRQPGALNSILWPLMRVHGIGTSQFCTPIDAAEPAMGDKKPILFWRGALRGFSTLDGGRANIKSVVKSYRANEIDRDALVAHLETIPRYSFVSRFFEQPGFDVGFCQGGGLDFFNQVPEIARYNRPYATHAEQLQYKYQMSIQGTDVGTSFAWHLSTNCVLFRENYPWEVFFDGHFRAWEDYIPVAADFSDVPETIQWCEEHPADCQRMIEKRHQVVPFLIDSAVLQDVSCRIVQRYETLYENWMTVSAIATAPSDAQQAPAEAEISIERDQGCDEASGPTLMGRLTTATMQTYRSMFAAKGHQGTKQPGNVHTSHERSDGEAKTPKVGELEELREFAQRVPHLEFKTVFDVGANIGQSAQMYRALWPSARIYAFEPVSATFAKLKASCDGDNNVHCFRLALSDRPGRGIVEAQPMRRMNKLLSAGEITKGPTEEVEVTTGAEFCQGHGIRSIDFLKIDAEGFDLKVCKGFEPLLREHRIAALQIEVGLQLEDPLHLPLHVFLTYLHPLGYRLYKIHNQYVMRDRPVGRRGNAVFVAPQYTTARKEARLAIGAKENDDSYRRSDSADSD